MGVPSFPEGMKKPTVPDGEAGVSSGGFFGSPRVASIARGVY
jgi:hypothetical protein